MNLVPRHYLIGDIFQEQFDEVFELNFIMSGKVGVGYRLFNEVIMGHVIKERETVNDYAIIRNKVSEFLYQPIIENVETYAIKRKVLNELLEDNFWKKFVPIWIRTYERKI